MSFVVEGTASVVSPPPAWGVLGSEEADVRLEADGKEWGRVMGWGEIPEQALGDLTELIDVTEEEQDWQERALCAQTDPEAFFPEKGGSTREAKRICLGCEVKDECLEYALAHDERFGIWGGLSERERRKLKKRAV
jgi:WhiB family redox-sensing transcriptional regulator